MLHQKQYLNSRIINIFATNVMLLNCLNEAIFSRCFIQSELLFFNVNMKS
jgi:hypothetical protein